MGCFVSSWAKIQILREATFFSNSSISEFGDTKKILRRYFEVCGESQYVKDYYLPCSMFINPRKRRVYPDEEREPPTKKKRVDRYIDCSTCNKSVLLASIGLKEFPTQVTCLLKRMQCLTIQ